jgi:activating signal cointegrator complex subunit 3
LDYLLNSWIARREANLHEKLCSAGTVTNAKEACAWLSYTYLFVRMLKNPLAYGVSWEELASDLRLEGHRKTLITTAARQLEK